MPKVSSKKLTSLHEEKVSLYKRIEEIEREERDEIQKIVLRWKK